jgi:hypothetical protein
MSRDHESVKKIHLGYLCPGQAAQEALRGFRGRTSPQVFTGCRFRIRTKL